MRATLMLAFLFCFSEAFVAPVVRPVAVPAAMRSAPVMMPVADSPSRVAGAATVPRVPGTRAVKFTGKKTGQAVRATGKGAATAVRATGKATRIVAATIISPVVTPVKRLRSARQTRMAARQLIKEDAVFDAPKPRFPTTPDYGQFYDEMMS